VIVPPASIVDIDVYISHPVVRIPLRLRCILLRRSTRRNRRTFPVIYWWTSTSMFLHNSTTWNDRVSCPWSGTRNSTISSGGVMDLQLNIHRNDDVLVLYKGCPAFFKKKTSLFCGTHFIEMSIIHFRNFFENITDTTHRYGL